MFEIKHYGKQRSYEDLKKEGKLKYNFVMQNYNNNGVIEKVPEQVGNHFNLIPGNSISAFTHLDKVYYQEEPFYSKQGSNVYTLRSSFLNKKISKFFISAINPIIKNLEYGKNTASRLREYTIQVPTKNEMIDLEFMESFITELEAERMTKLQAYLIATNLNNYILTANEQQVLDSFEQAEFKEFKVTDIFNVNNSKSILSRDIVAHSGTTPYLCASADNNAVSSYIAYDKQHIDTGNCVFIGGKTFVVTYQEHDFYSNDSHNLLLHLKNAKKSKSNQLYLATCVKKGLAHKYSWGDSISNRKIQKDIISLPIKDQQPDYAIMDTLISAIKKLVIKDVVLYTQAKTLSSDRDYANNDYHKDSDQLCLL